MPPDSISAPCAAEDARREASLLIPFTLGHLANDWAPCALWLIVPAIAAAMGLSPAEVGLLFAIHSIGSALAFMPAGVLADRVSNRGRLLALTFWWVSIGYVIASFAPGFWSLALLLAVAGMGDAAWHPIATGVLTQQMPDRRAQALGIHAVGGSLAEVLAPLCVGFLLAYVDWRGALQISVIPTVLMGIVFLRVAKHVPPSGHGSITRADLRLLWRAWRRPAGLMLIAMMGLYNMAGVALLAMTPLFLMTVHGLSPAATGVAFSLMVLIGALSQPFVGRLSDRIGRRPVFVAGNAVAAFAAVGIALAPGPWLAIAAIVVTATVLVGIRSAVLAAAVDFSGRREATTLGFAFAVMDGIGALGAVAAGAVGNIDLHYSFMLAAGLSALAAGLALGAPFTMSSGSGGK